MKDVCGKGSSLESRETKGPRRAQAGTSSLLLSFFFFFLLCDLAQTSSPLVPHHGRQELWGSMDREGTYVLNTVGNEGNTEADWLWGGQWERMTREPPVPLSFYLEGAGAETGFCQPHGASNDGTCYAWKSSASTAAEERSWL